MAVEGVLDIVIFLIDPRDPTSIYPESTALKRECVVYNKFFLSTYASAREWASLVWGDPGNYVLTYKELNRIGETEKIKLSTDLSSQSIALIAHNKKKIEMIQFAGNHEDLLSTFEEIIGTGTTGRLLKGEEKEGELDALLEGRSEEEKEDLKQAIEEVRRVGLRLENMQEKRSGPKGGDVQIGYDVMKGECHFDRLPNLMTMPMVGLMNSANPAVEANRLAEAIAELYDGKHCPIPASTFVYKKADPGPQVKEVMQRFEKADIVLLHGKPILLPGTHFGTVTRAPTDPQMIQDVYEKGAICEFSGLFLSKHGDEVAPSEFQRIGMSYEHLQDAGNNPECRSILLIGTPDERIEEYLKMANAIFKAQFPSVFVTDVTFARRLLGLKEKT